MTLDDAMLNMKRFEGSGAFSSMIEVLEASRQTAMEQMLDAEGDRLIELKGLAYGLRSLIEDMLRKLPEHDH